MAPLDWRPSLPTGARAAALNAPLKEQNRLAALALAGGLVAGVGVLWWRFNAVPANALMARLSDLVNYMLVLTDTYYPGWRAYVGGEETESLRANGLFRAIRFPTGQHAVVFEFRPQSFRLGVVISLALRSGRAARQGLSTQHFVISRRAPSARTMHRARSRPASCVW